MKLTKEEIETIKALADITYDCAEFMWNGIEFEPAGIKIETLCMNAVSLSSRVKDILNK